MPWPVGQDFNPIIIRMWVILTDADVLEDALRAIDLLFLCQLKHMRCFREFSVK
jgi:hypothetical protein